ncbi:MAG: tetratricopeptide repeat protein [Chlamydiae bacterium]|nr:tetratricopeptide repeat protein [Chlamydiota bacterium]MBI3276703.1 tetratricopeptide repeat protein [Chlamydiota bacterium]
MLLDRSKISKLSDADFESFQTLLIQECGFFFDPNRQELLFSGLSDRMAKRHIDSAKEYYDFIKNHPEGEIEIKSLIDLLTIGETYFFRNPAHFDVLKEHVLPLFVRDRSHGSKTLNLWSAGSSTGEEIYSLAITLLETLPEPETWNISLLATDVNRNHLLRAKEAIYSERAVRQVPPEWLEKYFTQRGRKYILKECVKKKVHFEYHNLIKDSFTLPGMQEVDILFCRNVIIYFNLETIRRLFNQFATCVREPGYLFMGEAETLWTLSDQFVPVEFPHSIIYRKSPHPGEEILKPFVDLPPFELLMFQDALTPSESLPLSTPLLEQGLAAMKQKNYTQAEHLLDEVLRLNPHQSSALLGKASILADQGQYESAVPILLRVVQLNNLSSPGYYLLGAVYQKLGKMDLAVEAFQKALYVNPSIALAHFELGNIYQCQKRVSKAKREFQNTLKALETKADEELIAFSEDITAGYLRAACRWHLDTYH